MFASKKITRDLKDHRRCCSFSTKQSNSAWYFSSVLAWEFALSSYPLVISRGSWEKTVLLFFLQFQSAPKKCSNLTVRTHSIYLHLQDENSSPSLNALLGGDSAGDATPCWDWRLSDHPSLAPLTAAGHARGSPPHPTIQEEPKPSFTLSLHQPTCLSLLG